MIAVYEKSFDQRWKLVAYNDSKLPAKSVNGTTVERSGTFTIPDDCIVNGTPNLKAVEALFPAPRD